MMEDRRLAAIMFTDIAGYTALMGKDEDKAFDMLKKNHLIHEDLINKYKGTLIKEIGDGTLASFPLASDAVRCAVDIQMEAKNQEIPLKIGIHQGEMVMAGADVLGDGVNVASRLQEISEEGCITISGKVYSDIKNKSDINTKYLGEKKLKNVEDQANLNVQLIEAGNDEHIWAKEYNRDWSDIFKVQKEVARSIADEIYANLTREEKEGIDVIPTNNMTAYEYFLKGNEIFWEGRGTYDLEKINESFGYYERAIELDENFSFAYTGLGRIYWTLAHIEPETEKPKLWNNAQKSLKKAIDLDPYNGWAYSEMGVIFHNWNWDSTTARSYAEMALKLTPNDWNSFRQYIVLEERIGNCEKVEKLLNIAKERFPQIDQYSYYSNNIPVLRCQQKWDEIAAIADENWDEMSNSTVTFMAYIHINNLDRADQVVRIMKERSFTRSYDLIWDAILYAKKGDKNSTLQTIDSMRQLSSSEYIANVQYAAIYATLGDKDQMYDHLGLALSSREYMLHLLNNSYSVFIPYQNEDRFNSSTGFPSAYPSPTCE
ncbi:adenylate/guanylate cyclase domain-containing protein [Bacteroidota bacterium]